MRSAPMITFDIGTVLALGGHQVWKFKKSAKNKHQSYPLNRFEQQRPRGENRWPAIEVRDNGFGDRLRGTIEAIRVNRLDLRPER